MNLMNITKISRYCGFLIAMLVLAVVLPTADAQDIIDFELEPKPENVVPDGWLNNRNDRSTRNASTWMPDANLRAAVTAELSACDPSLTLTQRNLRVLSSINANGQDKTPITNLKGLEYATNLTWLDLSENNITSLTRLSGLTNLTDLNLSENNITSLTSLSGLVNLERLSLASNSNNSVSLSNISALSNMTNMMSLNLSGNNIADISDLSDMTSLTGLYLGSNDLDDISDLSNFSDLESLSLYENNYESTTALDISALAGLTNLTFLHLGRNEINDISALSGLTNLTSLYLQSNNITDFSTLADLTSLETLELGFNGIDDTDITHLSGLTQLNHLYLGQNDIDDISDLSGLVNLEQLNLSGNDDIDDISYLSDMVDMQILILSSNDIDDIIPLADMVNLENLELSGNDIKTIGVLRSLMSLERVDLSVNPVWDTLTNRDTITILRGRLVEVIIDNLVPASGQGRRIEPSVSFTLPSGPQNSAFDVSVVFSEAVYDFDQTELDLDPTNIASITSTAFTISEDETTYTATITPTTDGTLTFSVDAGVARNTAYNYNTAATSGSVTIDMEAPNVSLNVPSGTQNAAFEVTFTFTEPVTGFTTSSVELGGVSAEISEPQPDSADKKIYTATITPTDTAAGNITITIPENAITDIAGNVNTAAVRESVAVDLPPQVSFDIPSGVQYSAFYVPISFSESVTDFTEDDIELGGTATADIEFIGGASSFHYSLQITPTSQGDLTITVLADAVMDATNNGNIATTSESISVDVDFVIEIPDANLASALRHNLRLDAGDDITKSQMLKLTGFWYTLPSSPISNLSGLEHATRLTALLLPGNDIVDVSPLAGMTALTRLDLSTNEIVDISHLSRLTSLTELDLTENNVADISSLSNMTSLTLLDLTTNDVTDISPLSTLTSLETLFLSENSITDLSALSSLTALTRLYLDYNSITNVEALAGLVNLTELKLSDNNILDTSPLYDLTQQSSPVDLDIEVSEFAPWDVNEDGNVDNTDSVLVIAALGQTGNAITDPRTDVNGDGTVDKNDVTLVTDNLDTGGGSPSSSSAFTLLDQEILKSLDRGVLESYLHTLRAESDGSLKYLRAIAILERVLVMTRPKETELLANYPNPFNPETWIPYHLANTSAVRITIYDVHGTVVRRLDLGHQREGYYTNQSRAAYWDGRNDVGERVASGVYFYQLQADNVSLLRKMVILK